MRARVEIVFAALLAPAAARAQAVCAAPEASALWARIPDDLREGAWIARGDGDDGRLDPAPRVLTAELDGAAPREAVLAVDAIRRGAESRSLVWTFGCRDGAWRALGVLSLGVDAAWDGTLDARPGLAALRVERAPGMDHDFLRVEHLDVRGGADPRFERRRLVLIHVRDGLPFAALDLALREHVLAGPARATVYEATRALDLRAPRATLRVRTFSGSPPRWRACRTALRLEGRSYRAADPACFER
ncbi:MAG: hypothetical protein R3A48_26975 [Polyangiales bacterium]